jgi:hypothetical protein
VVDGLVNNAPGSLYTVAFGRLRETLRSSLTFDVDIRDPDGDLVDRLGVEVGYSFQHGIKFRYEVTYQNADPAFRYFDSPQRMVDAITDHLSIFIHTPAQD